MAGTRSALIVAAYDFQDEKFRRLRAPAQDAEALAGVLGDDQVGGFDVKTLVNEPCDVVAQELEAFCSDRTPDDLLLLYFSCHGIKDAAGRLYFAMANTRFDRLRSTGVSATFVSEQMEYSRSRRIALLLDCCYSGAFLKGLRARASEGVQVQDHFEGRGRAVITASRATEYAFEGDQLSVGQAQPSLFTSAIVQGLATGRPTAMATGSSRSTSSTTTSTTRCAARWWGRPPAGGSTSRVSWWWPAIPTLLSCPPSCRWNCSMRSTANRRRIASERSRFWRGGWSGALRPRS